jgi:hypothetical protein
MPATGLPSLKLNANLKTGFTNRKANQEYEKQGLHPKP